MCMLGTRDGVTGKKVMATETKICKDCNHQCHCKEDLHADEYGLCPCKACKC